MKTLMTAIAMTIAGLGAGGTHAAQSAQPAESAPEIHRYLVERSFPPGAIAGVDAAAKQKVNVNNSTRNVTWVKSYMNPDQTKTYCVYKGPSEQAVRDVAGMNGLPVDNVTEIPGDIKREPAAGDAAAPGTARYLVRRSGTDKVATSKDAKLLTAYGVAARVGANGKASYSVYEAKSLGAVARAASAGGARVESIVEIPQTLMPY